jgi:hypothetical protein
MTDPPEVAVRLVGPERKQRVDDLFGAVEVSHVPLAGTHAELGRMQA